MRKNPLKILGVAVMVSVFFGASAAPSKYDGTYSAVLSCGVHATNGKPAFRHAFVASISGGKFSGVLNFPPNQPTDITNWTGEIAADGLRVIGSAKRISGGSWSYSLSGAPSNPTNISLNGPLLSDAGVKLRDCSVELAMVQSGASPQSPPQAAPASNGAPDRSAAVGNVQVPVKADLGQGVQGQPTQVTSNPIDQQKKTNPNEVWISFNPSITVQQRQFCRIIENFRTENAIAQQTKNQIKVNETFRSLVQSLTALLPDGKFQGWVMRTVYVSQASDGSAEVLLELPCNVYVGSNACDANPNNFYGTAPEGSRIYTELAKMTVGDFALTSGKFVFSDDKAFDRKRSVASYGYMKTASHCRAKTIASDSDFFGLALDVISTIK